jgi:hypothetical protein
VRDQLGHHLLLHVQWEIEQLYILGLVNQQVCLVGRTT